MAIGVAKIRDANVYVDGTSTHGHASEITLPDIEASMSEYKALGMVVIASEFNTFASESGSLIAEVIRVSSP